MAAPDIARDFDTIVARRTAFLTEYQDAAHARRYADFVARVRAAETERAPGREGLAEAVAHNLFRLRAVKDEYEVARLHGSEAFHAAIAEHFEGDYRIRFHIAPPLLARRDPNTGHLRKRAYGQWVLGLFRLLARLKGLRGTAFDIFGYTAERRAERRLARDYEATVEELLRTLDADNHALAVEIAALPDRIRGFGHVRAGAMAETAGRRDELLAAWRNPESRASAAE